MASKSTSATPCLRPLFGFLCISGGNFKVLEIKHILSHCLYLWVHRFHLSVVGDALPALAHTVLELAGTQTLLLPQFPYCAIPFSVIFSFQKPSSFSVWNGYLIVSLLSSTLLPLLNAGFIFHLVNSKSNLSLRGFLRGTTLVFPLQSRSTWFILMHSCTLGLLRLPPPIDCQHFK